MKIVLLCAGYGSRLRPHTLTRPKALLQVAGKPVISHVLAKLLELRLIPRFTENLEFIFVVGYLGDQLISYIQEEYVKRLRIKASFVEQAAPLGSAHAVVQAREAIFTSGQDSDLMLIYSDTLFEADLDRLTSVRVGSEGTICWREVEDVSNYGAILVDPATGFVTKLVEKPQTFVSNQAVVSPYYFTSAKNLFAALDQQFARKRMTKGEYYLTDAVEIMLEEGAKFEEREISLWLDTGNFENILETNRVLLTSGQKAGGKIFRISGTSLIIEPCFIPPGTFLERSVIGPYVSLGTGVSIKESVVSECIIENGAQIEKAILNRALVGRRSSLTGNSFEDLSLGDYSQI